MSLPAPHVRRPLLEHFRSTAHARTVPFQLRRTFCHPQVESIFRELGDQDGLTRSLANQAVLLGVNLGRRSEALPKAEEALSICLQAGLNTLVEQVKRIVDFLRSQK